MTLVYRYPLLATILCVLLQMGTAQSSGKITYMEDLTFDLPPHVRAQFKDIPKSKKDRKILTWRDQEVSYVNDPDEEKGQEVRRKGNAMIIKGSKKAIKYMDYDTGLLLEEKDMMRKSFSIKDTITSYAWKISAGEQRDIKGYTCIKATTTSDTTDIVAWWTPQIPVSYGPDGYGGLPGMILALGYGADKAILAQDISLDPAEAVEITVLQEQKGTLSRLEYDTKMEQRKAEMQQMWGGSKKRSKTRGGW